MMQGTLFTNTPNGPEPLVDPARLARATDPPASHAAAEAIAPNLPKLHEYVLALVKRFPGYTASELARANEIGDPRVINRRLGEMELRGMVVRGPERACKVSGRKAATWTETTKE
jgi:hypothetical protein